MERPTGPPLGAATQSTGRPMVDNRLPRQPPLNTVRRIPQNGIIRHATSSSSLSSGPPISAGQVVALAKEAMKNALYENETKAAEASGVSSELKPGITIDLSHKQIQRFPEEVVDIIKHELERLALSHNQISTFPSRFSECTSLRYLNVRNNVIRDFPLCICQLTSLEILDLKGNKLKTIPPELVKLTSLKVLSVEKNRIEVLPLCLADMASLQVIKLQGNPVRFPPKEILQPSATSPPNGTSETEIDSAITSQIKKFLRERQKAITDRSETESGGEESSEGTETPRPMKRVMSGRFPIKVNGVDVPDLRSPALQRPPPIPSRSHYRGLSQVNAAARRPGVMPLTIGSTNERVRSNSENTLSGSRVSTLSDRSRRMGIVSKKPSELDTVDEMRNNRHSHYRGLSHGSAISGSSNGSNGISKSPASPADSAMLRPTYVRRLSSLPERKRASNSPDIVIEGAKGILYALFEIHPLIQSLLGLLRDSTNKRSSLERVFYNATTQVEELDRDIIGYENYSEEDEEATPRSNETVHSACLTAVGAYVHVSALLTKNVNTLINNGDPRYLRTLLLHVYGSLVEVRNAGADLFTEGQTRMSRISEVNEGTIRSQPRDKSVTPTRERPGTAPRGRSTTVVQHPSNLRVATDAGPPPFLNSANRMINMSAATPRSGDSFASSNTSAGRMNGGEFTDEDAVFENIFLHLQQTSEMSIRSLPPVISHFITAMKISSQQSNPEQPKHFWQNLIQKTDLALRTTDALKRRLSTIKLKEPGIRTQGAFWELCNAFIETYADLAIRVKEAKATTHLLPADVIVLLRPLQKEIKKCTLLIQQSPWSYLAQPQSSNSMSNGSSYTTKSPASQIPLPMTPQSAALGPAVQATVPSTPQSASYNAMFSGNVFERADALLSMNGNSAASSRAGTMTSNDGSMIPSSMLSPLNSMNSRFNGNSRVAF